MKNLLLVFHILLIFSIVGCVAKPKGVYVGEKKDGERHGQGTVTYADGKKYEGQFSKGRKHGEGTQTWSDGRKYVGEWKKSKRAECCRYNVQLGQFIPASTGQRAFR